MTSPAGHDSAKVVQINATLFQNINLCVTQAKAFVKSRAALGWFAGVSRSLSIEQVVAHVTLRGGCGSCGGS